MSDHLKRIATPRTWSISRKSNVFITRPKPGKNHDLSLPLSTVLKEIIGFCSTTRQVKAVLEANQIMVDGAIRRDHRYPVGLYEVISIVGDKQSYRIVLSGKGKLTAMAIDEKEKSQTLFKISSKQMSGKDSFVIGLLNGRNVNVAAKEAAKMTVGDTIVLDDKGAISKHLPLKKGTFVQFIGGRHMGAQGVVENTDGNTITVLIGEQPTETLKQYAFVVGEKAPLVKISE
jgi:small subunit ribosomal protein S4e